MLVRWHIQSTKFRSNGEIREEHIIKPHRYNYRHVPIAELLCSITGCVRSVDITVENWLLKKK